MKEIIEILVLVILSIAGVIAVIDALLLEIKFIKDLKLQKRLDVEMRQAIKKLEEDFKN